MAGPREAVDGLDPKHDRFGKGISDGVCCVMARDAGEGLPIRRHVRETVTVATIRRIRPQTGAAFATRTAFADEGLAV